jgi:hypothetical protein
MRMDAPIKFFFVTRKNFSILNARFILLSAYERSPQLNVNAH